MSDERKLIFTKTGFGVKEISKEIGIKRNLKTLIHILKQSRSRKMSDEDINAKKWFEECSKYFTRCSKLEQQLAERDAENKMMRECLEFYADEINWSNFVEFNDQLNDWESFDDFSEDGCDKGGKRAREVLNKLKENEK